MALNGKKVALLVEQIYEDQEFWYPYFRMKEAGAEVVVVAPKAGEVYPSKHGYPARSDRAADQVSAAEFDAVIIPGGYSPDHMRRSAALVKFVRDMGEQGKIVAAICHAGWMLASAGLLKGRTATSFASIKDDVINAGANWVDREVVRDGNVITSRFPNDLPAFCREIVAALESTAVPQRAR